MSIVRRLFPFLLLAAALPAQEAVTGWITELVRKKDDADIALVEKIAGVRTREAAEGLLKALDAVSTLLYRREIVKGLLQFTTQPDAEQPVLDKLANLAGNPEAEEELRVLAITGLGQSPKIGKNLLKKIVEAEIPDTLREPAMKEHIKLASADDAAWYRFLWNLKQDQRKDSKGNIAPPELNSIRQLAVRGALPFLGEEEIADGIKKEVDPKIRRTLLAFMHKQAMPRTAEVAEWLLDRVDYPGADRSDAARILVERTGTKAVNTFVELAKKRDVTQEDLRLTMASLIAGMNDEATEKRMSKLIGKGKPHEKVFALLCTQNVKDPKILPLIRKGLADEALEVRRATALVLGIRRDRESVPELRELLTASKNAGDARLALEAITAIEGLTSAWLKEVTAFTTHADRETRNAAVAVLGQARDKKHVGVVAQALEHDDWSTRFAAIDALQAIRDKQGVAKLIARMPIETGRMKKRIAEALWQLTAQPFDEDHTRWQGWWNEAGELFTIASEKDLDKAAAERERKRLAARTTSTAKFFGLKVESQRVIFILDVSGSMLESMYGRYVGKRGAARIDVAKQELSQAIQNLEPGTLFNILIFSSSVARWQKEGIVVASPETRKAALEWIERLGASGATNLYDSVKIGFEDKDVDTIFIMSDGEPTNGEVIDPHRIREDVAFWNKYRKIKINTIAIGGNLEILEWLAKDSGGTYVQMR
ncbi:MAG: HEAT repeat domain-containing protein [Planctomycetota bacterium]